MELITEPSVARARACAIGLAYARRRDAEGVQELIDIAEGESRVLARARDVLPSLAGVDPDTRRHADHLLDEASRRAACPTAAAAGDDELNPTA